MHFIGVFNRDGGTFRTMDMAQFAASAEQVFAEAGHTLECRAIAGERLMAELERAARDPTAGAILAGGGDGTISAAAGVCFSHKLPLAVLPAGTMNLFARSLRVPQNLEEALGAIAGGTLGAVDIATANGRPFVHQFAVGLHPRLVKMRNAMTYQSRLGKILASVRSVYGALARPLVFDIEIRTPTGIEHRRATAISVSNNVLGEGHIPYAEDIDRGVLGVYVVRPMPLTGLLKLVASLVMGSWKSHPLVSEREVEQVTLNFPRRKRSSRALVDGELIPLESRVDLTIHKGALQVIQPRTAESAEEGHVEDALPERSP